MSDKFSGFDLGKAPEPSKSFTGFSLGEDAGGSGRGPLDNAPDDTTLDSVVKGAGTAIMKGVSSIPGMVGDLREGGQYLARRAIGAFTGESPEELKAKGEQTRKLADDSVVGRAMSVIPRVENLPSGREIFKKVKDATGSGEYVPDSRIGKYAMLATEGLAGAFSPVGVARKALEMPTRSAAKEAIKTTAKTAPLVATGAPAADIATEFTGDPLAGIAAGAAAPAAAGKVVDSGAKLLPTVRQGTKQAKADVLFKEGFENPEAAAAALANRKPGDIGTTGEITGDKGMQISEHRAQSLDDKARAGIADIRGKQNTARINAIEALQPNGDPRLVSRAFDEHLEDVGRTYDQAIAAAEQRAAALANQNIPNFRPEDVGAAQRAILEAERVRANEARRALYEAIDPDGTLAIVTQPFSQRAAELISTHPETAAPLSARTMDPFEKAQQLRQTTSFRDLRALDENITGAMKEANIAGRANESRLLGELKTAIKQSMTDAVENQAAWERGALQRGEINAESTLASRLEQWRNDFYRAREAAAGETVARATGTGPASDVVVSGGARGSGEGRGDPSGGARVQGESTPFDAAARDRLSAANEAHAAYVQQFRMGAPAKILETTGFVGQPKLYDTKVVDTAFVPGQGGYETAGHVMQGSGAQGPAIMQQMALLKLREALDNNGRLTQRGLDSWRDKYSGALRAIDEATPGWSRQFDNIAQATEAIQTVQAARRQAIAEDQTAVAKKFLGLNDSDDIVASVGQLMNSNKSGQQTAELVASMRGDPAALEGVRRAGVQWMLNDFATGSVRDGNRVLSGPRLLAYMDEHADALRNIYGDAGLANMRAIAEDVMRTQAASTAAATAGSDTAAKLHKHMKEASEAAQRQSTINNALSFGLWDALQSMSPAKLTAVMGGRWIANAVENLRSKGIRDINDLVVEGMLNPKVGEAMLKRAMTSDGAPNLAGYAALIGALDEVKNEDRPQRASGGRVGIDHVAEASRYVRLAAKAKAQHAKVTESFLNTPDDVVASALAKAREAI